MKASFKKHRLNFKRPGGTSRGILKTKDSWILCLEENSHRGYGECSIIEGLSWDDPNRIESVVLEVCEALSLAKPLPDLTDFPAVQMGLETALLSLNSPTVWNLFPSAFSRGEASIPINGLVWMGTIDFMQEQIDDLLNRGFDCIKLKIGALHFEEEFQLLKSLRKRYSLSSLILRVDANVAFHSKEALGKLEQLATLGIHSIEQPIATGQWEEMAKLCNKSPIPIALDEELIGCQQAAKRKQMLEAIHPHYLILKPSLLGGFSHADAWIDLAEELQIGWWATSALESNIGLNAIAQWAYTKKLSIPQGLGTGSLFTNNFESPLVIKKDCLWTDNSISWTQNLTDVC